MTKNEREQFKAEFIVSDCTSIKEFCKIKGINWQNIKNYCAKEKWIEQKNEHIRTVSEQVMNADLENRTKEAVRNIEIRQNDTLNATQKAKDLFYKLISQPNLEAKDLNALASALYRINEIEATILNGNKVNKEQKDALNQLCEAIRGATKDE